MAQDQRPALGKHKCSSFKDLTLVSTGTALTIWLMDAYVSILSSHETLRTKVIKLFHDLLNNSVNHSTMIVPLRLVFTFTFCLGIVHMDTKGLSVSEMSVK